MSNKRRDYTKFSRESSESGAVETVENIIEEVEETKPEPKIGIVTDCIKLNVRKNPDPNAEIVCEVSAATDLMIDEEQSTDTFYKVFTAAGVEGYCMKRFVAIKP